MAESNNSRQQGGGSFPVRSLTMRTPHSHRAMDLTRNVDRFLHRSVNRPERYSKESAVLEQAFAVVDAALNGLETDRRKNREPRDLYTLLTNREMLPADPYGNQGSPGAEASTPKSDPAATSAPAASEADAPQEGDGDESSARPFQL